MNIQRNLHHPPEKSFKYELMSQNKKNCGLTKCKLQRHKTLFYDLNFSIHWILLIMYNNINILRTSSILNQISETASPHKLHKNYLLNMGGGAGEGILIFAFRKKKKFNFFFNHWELKRPISTTHLT